MCSCKYEMCHLFVTRLNSANDMRLSSWLFFQHFQSPFYFFSVPIQMFYDYMFIEQKFLNTSYFPRYFSGYWVITVNKKMYLSSLILHSTLSGRQIMTTANPLEKLCKSNMSKMWKKNKSTFKHGHSRTYINNI